MKKILKRFSNIFIFIFTIMLLALQIYGQTTSDVIASFYQKTNNQDATFKELSCIYSPTTLEGELSSDEIISDMEIVTTGGIGTVLTIETYGENFQVIGSYSTTIEYAKEYNYIKTDIFSGECICYMVRLMLI